MQRNATSSTLQRTDRTTGKRGEEKQMIGFIIGALIGAVLGGLLTAFIVMSVIKKSNDWGDLDGTEPSMTSFNVIKSDDKVGKNKRLKNLI